MSLARIVALLPKRPADLIALAQGHFARFIAVGLIGLATDALLFTLFHNLGLSKAAARALSLAGATGVTWRLNRRFTFKAKGRGDVGELVRYLTVTLLAQGLSYTIFLTLCVIEPGLPPLAALFIGAVIATVFSFTGQRLITFATASASSNAPQNV